MKILRVLGLAAGALLVIGVVGLGMARLIINGPIGPLAGGALEGEERPAPDDWGFTNEHTTIAVEVGIDDPHSVTVVCFVVEGDLYIPAQDAAQKEWTQTAMADGRARVRVDDTIYPVQLVRVTEPATLDAAIQSAGQKYAQMAARVGDALPEGVWLFRADRRG